MVQSAAGTEHAGGKRRVQQGREVKGPEDGNRHTELAEDDGGDHTLFHDFTQRTTISWSQFRIYSIRCIRSI